MCVPLLSGSIIYTTGEAREIVESCLTVKEDVGYKEARNLIKKRWGKSYRIAIGYIDKLTKGPAIKAEEKKYIKAEEGDALRRFSTLLTSCKTPLRRQDISTRWKTLSL